MSQQQPPFDPGAPQPTLRPRHEMPPSPQPIVPTAPQPPPPHPPYGMLPPPQPPPTRQQEPPSRGGGATHVVTLIVAVIAIVGSVVTTIVGDTLSDHRRQAEERRIAYRHLQAAARDLAPEDTSATWKLLKQYANTVRTIKTYRDDSGREDLLPQIDSLREAQDQELVVNQIGLDHLSLKRDSSLVKAYPAPVAK